MQRRQLSWAFNDKHMPSAHHSQSKRCGLLRARRGLPSTGDPASGEVLVGSWRVSPCLGDWGEASPRAAQGSLLSWSISGYLSSSLSPPLAPRLPAVSRVGVGPGAGPAARARDGGCRPCSWPAPRHCPLPLPAPHLGVAQAAPAFTLRVSQQPLAALHPPRCSDLANRARRCRSPSPPTGTPSTLNPFPLGVDSSPSLDFLIL